MTNPFDDGYERSEAFTMKIQNDVTHPVHSTDKPAAKPGVAPGRVAPTGASTDSVKISDVSRSLVGATTGVEAPFDATRVDAIKAAIGAGQFKVDPEAVADKVIASASQLLGKA